MHKLLSRRRFLAFLLGSVSTISLTQRAYGYQLCGYDNLPPYICDAAIKSQKFRRVGAYQETMVWCWAAVLQMIFAWYGKQISQSHLVAQTYGAAIPTTIDPHKLLRATNGYYHDDHGDRFTVRSRIFSADFGISQLTNCDIIESLRNERPLVICNQSHMMVLIGVTYDRRSDCELPNISAAWVADPYPQTLWAPDMGPGFRDLPRSDLAPPPHGQLRFLADIRVA